MDDYCDRRAALSTIAAGSAALAGCFDLGSGDGSDDGSGPGEGGTGGGAVGSWPAIGGGELLSDFEDLSEWTVRGGSLEAAPEEARTGSQAAVLEGDGAEVRMTLGFPDRLDLRDWDTSLAVKAESATRIVVEFIAPDREHRLTTVRPIPGDFDGWFRLDCGFEHKPDDDPDLSNVARINVIAADHDGESPRIVVDDLRRTESVDGGKAILACYDGRDSHYEIAADLLAERGWPAAVAVDPARIGGSGRLDVDQLRELQDRGWDVCAYPVSEGDLAHQPQDRQEGVVTSVQESLARQGFEEGSRHFFYPSWRDLSPSLLETVRGHHETAFVFGSCPVGAPPTGSHTIPVIWGPALRNGVRRHINLCYQYGQLTVIRIPPIVDDEDPDGDVMTLGEFEHLLDHLEHREMDLITPSDLVDGMDGTDRTVPDETVTKPDGVIVEAGRTHTVTGSGSTTTDAFALDAGVAVADLSIDGSTAAATLVPDDGGSGDDLATASTGGDSIRPVEAGSYRLEIETDGEWSVDLSQPEIHADDLADLPIETSGSGSDVVGPVWAPDDLGLALTHDGDGRFVVDGYLADGSRERLANDEGAFDASRSFAAGGVCWLDVEANGAWTLSADESS